MDQSEIKISINLDENKIPEKMEWFASDANQGGVTDAVLLSIWDKKELNTMRIDLWTKDMQVDAMKQFIFQHVMTLADTLERATSESEMANDMRDFGNYFKDRMKV